MESINLNLYKVFYEVAQSDSFKKAAKSLFISQSAVSKSIKNLEIELNVSLFYRGNKGICLTPDGEILLKYIHEAYNILLAGKRMLNNNNSINNGAIVIGAQSHIVRYYLLEKLSNFQQSFPTISIKIIDLSTRDLLEALEKHVVDIVIDSSPIETIYNNTIVKPVAYLDTCFIKSPKNLNVIKKVSDLIKERIILPLERSSLRKTLIKDIETENIVIKPTIELETEELIIETVRKNMGVGYVVKKAVDYLVESNIIEILELNKDLPKVEINLIYVESNLTKIAKIFIEEFIYEKQG